MIERTRPLRGVTLGISISESPEAEARGVPDWQVPRITLQFVLAFSGQGVSLVFGHDWREDGVMEAVHALVRQMSPSPFAALDGASAPTPARKPLRNILAWPDEPSLTAEARLQLAATLAVETAGLPPRLVPMEDSARSAGRTSDAFRYLRARALTLARQRICRISDALLCVGGRRGPSEGRFPGIIEEAYLMLREGRPLYVAGFLGGAAADVIDGIEERQMPEYLRENAELADRLYRTDAKWDRAGDEVERVTDPAVVWRTFGAARASFQNQSNGLSWGENQELFRAQNLERVIDLVLRGLARLKQKHH